MDNAFVVLIVLYFSFCLPPFLSHLFLLLFISISVSLLFSFLPSFLLSLSLSSISPVKRLTAHRCLFFLLVAAVTRPSTCNRDDEGEGQVEAFSAQLSVTGQVTPTPIWSVDWGPTLALEDETHHFLSSQEADLYHHGHEVPTTTAEAWLHHQSAPGSVLPQEPLDLLEAPDAEGVEDGGSEAEEREPEEGGHHRNQ